MQWTDDQWRAITEKDQDILVAAAAGSGKTAVLVERIIRRITHDHINIDELLVVTFTNASAKEMKERITAALKKAYDTQPTNHLKEQLIKINQAEISTLHSFCLKLIEQYYYTIDLDPSFRTANDEERSLLLIEAIDQVLEAHYESPSDAFLKTSLHLSSDRSDQGLRQIITQMYYFAVANPKPYAWLDAVVVDYSSMTVSSPLMNQVASFIQHELIRIERQLRQSLEDLNNKAYEKQYDALSSLINQLSHIPTTVDEQYTLLESLVDFKMPAFRIPKKYEDFRHDEGFEKQIKDAIKQHIEQLIALKTDYLSRPPAELISDMRSMTDEVTVLSNITKEVIETFQQLKISKKIIDFTDYEHMALQILINNDQPTAIAQNLRAHYKELMIDEYQDTNRVQEAIIQILNDNHLFMVGDVKQSIYKFRQAEPSLFLEKYERFNTSNDGLVIDLSKNFRSRASVIDDTNEVFKRIMDEAVGEIQYDDKQQLYYGAPFDEVRGQSELTIINKELSNDLTESEWIAHRIKEIIQYERVYDMKTGDYRAATYRDIVILERNNTNASVHQQVMNAHQIPFYVESKSGFFETDEIRTVLSLLRVVDNPLQDIHVIGLLRSVIYQVSERDLVTIRLHNRQAFIYENIVALSRMPGELSTKLERIVQDISRYRKQAQTISTRQLLENIYDELNILERFNMLPSGAQRKANLLYLQSKADRFEESSYRGLYQFILFVDHLLSMRQDFGEVNILPDDADVVRMLTVHKSKGLEFPFVIYSNLGKEFNTRDLSSAVLMNQRLGLAINYYNEAGHYIYPTLMTKMFEHQMKNESISEEMRLMYVAFTRAKEKLILLGSAKPQSIEKWATAALDSKLDEAFRQSSKSALQLIVGSVMNERRPIPSIPVTLVDEVEPLVEVDNKSDDQEIMNSAPWLKERASYVYPYLYLQSYPTKESVSEIKRQTEVDDDVTTWTLMNQTKLAQNSYERPKFLTEQKRTRTEIGTLMHTVMQHLPYEDLAWSDELVLNFLQQLVEEKKIKESDIKDINVAQITAYTQSLLYKMVTSAQEVYKELPFVIGKSYLTEPIKDAPHESLVQGMIDCVFKLDGVYYFIDFKTDALIQRRGQTKDEALEQLKERYNVQMYYYKKTLEEVLNTKVRGYLYFFEYKEIEVK